MTALPAREASDRLLAAAHAAGSMVLEGLAVLHSLPVTGAAGATGRTWCVVVAGHDGRVLGFVHELVEHVPGSPLTVRQSSGDATERYRLLATRSGTVVVLRFTGVEVVHAGLRDAVERRLAGR